MESAERRSGSQDRLSSWTFHVQCVAALVDVRLGTGTPRNRIRIEVDEQVPPALVVLAAAVLRIDCEPVRIELCSILDFVNAEPGEVYVSIFFVLYFQISCG